MLNKVGREQVQELKKATIDSAALATVGGPQAVNKLEDHVAVADLKRMEIDLYSEWCDSRIQMHNNA